MSIIQARNCGGLAWGGGPGNGDTKIMPILEVELVELSDRLEVT